MSELQTHPLLEKPNAVIFLTLKVNLTNKEIKWHCFTCGKVFLTTYNKELKAVFEGKPVHLQNYSGILCGNCKTLYITE